MKESPERTQVHNHRDARKATDREERERERVQRFEERRDPGKEMS
jgi:hypothetical protein